MSEMTDVPEMTDLPDKPDESDEPGTPDEPDMLDEPGTSNKPDEPGELRTPDKPDESDKPGTLDVPDELRKPDEPDMLDEPGTSNKPDEPGTPEIADVEDSQVEAAESVEETSLAEAPVTGLEGDSNELIGETASAGVPPSGLQNARPEASTSAPSTGQTAPTAPRAPGFHVLNLGCKVNRAESDTMAASCLAAGAVRTSPELADVAIVNTCTVTAEADAKTRKAIRKLARTCSGPVVVTGCAAALNAEELAALAPNVVVEPVRLKASQIAVDILSGLMATTGPGAGPGAGTGDGDFDGCDRERPASHVQSPSRGKEDTAGIRSQANPTRSSALSASSPHAVRLRAGSGFKTRMDIKIQDGCPNACTFCIVHVARGKATSVEAADVVAQVESAAAAGVGEVVLTGINLGCYDSEGMRLPDLLERLMRTPIGRVRISSIEPPHVDGRLAQVMSGNPQRICAHLHVPLQSGCDRTLEEMGRLYDSKEFEQRIGLIRQACPELALTTDVIVGFPGETEEDFAESYGFCRRMGFSKMHVFRYSRRAGTPAAEMPGQVAPETMAQRAGKMRDLSDLMRMDDAKARIGKRERLLMMSPTVGMASSYHDTVLEEMQVEGAFVDVEITGATEDGRLFGKPL